QGRGAVEWTTSGFDAQRSAWIRNDPRISLETLQKPGASGPFKFLWKLKLEYEPAAATALTEPILLDRLIGFRGFKSIAFVATASETVHAIDVDVGTTLWKYHINYSASPPPLLAGTPAAPGGLGRGPSGTEEGRAVRVRRRRRRARWTFGRGGRRPRPRRDDARGGGERSRRRAGASRHARRELRRCSRIGGSGGHSCARWL